MASVWGTAHSRGRLPLLLMLLVCLPFTTVFFCEYGLYYFYVAFCGGWPKETGSNSHHHQGGLNLLILSDTHLIGFVICALSAPS